ncbi:MAG TPA: FtsQ-type POTRA domain-containing protein [Vicinamibacterales bacterium]|nr:FtsQ-type POTRA domain-containing protein [Vicinamibacterales bacterium]
MWLAALLALLVSSAPQEPREVLAQIRIQGNVATTDEEVRRLADVQVGMPFLPTTVDDVSARLRQTRRFVSVQVLKRFASISDPSQIVLVIILDEGPVRIEMTGDPTNPTRVVKNNRPRFLYLPVLDAEDGYGLTYGLRLGLPDPAGARSRLSFPLTWGGDKRVGAELEKTFQDEPLERLTVGGSISRRTNPFYQQDDDRQRVWVRGEREVRPKVRLGATAGWQHDSFLALSDQVGQLGVDVVVDTRTDAVLPRDAIFAKASVDYLRLPDGGASRTELDGRGYIGLFGQNILAVRALRMDSDKPLPPYMKPLLGGMANLRGFAAGSAVGDTLVAGSAELIVPLSSPLEIGKIGVSGFVDTGTIYDKGQRFSDQSLKEGYGGSVWFAAAFVKINLAVAHGRGSSTRVHIGADITF